MAVAFKWLCYSNMLAHNFFPPKYQVGIVSFEQDHVPATLVSSSTLCMGPARAVVVCAGPVLQATP